MGRFVFCVLLVACRLYSEHEPVLLEKPNCGGVLIQPNVVVTTVHCASHRARLISPKPMEVQKIIHHPDGRLALLFLTDPLPESPVIFMKEEPRRGMNVMIKSKDQSVENRIESVDHYYVKIFSELKPYLEGAPLWIVLGPTQVFLLSGIMIGENIALRLDPYKKFIREHLKGKEISLPAQIVPNKPISVAAHVDSVVAQTHTAEAIPVPQPQPPEPEPVVRPVSNTPESLGCVCSQIRR